MNGDLVAMSGRKGCDTSRYFGERSRVLADVQKPKKELRNAKKSPTVVDDVGHCMNHAEYTDEPADHFMEVDMTIER